MKKIILILAAIVLLAAPAYAAEYTCGTTGVTNSCTPEGLTSLLGSATDGDILRIAPGVHAWNSPVTVNKRVIITGGGTLPDGGSADPTGSMNFPTQLNINRNTAFFVNGATAGKLLRISGLQINGNGPGFSYNNGSNNAIIVLHTNNNATYRIDNMYFNQTGTNMTTFQSNGIKAYGVLDHIYQYNTGSGNFPRFIQNTGHGGDAGNTDWNRATKWGSEDFVYIENCTIIYPNPNSQQPALFNDQQGGGRLVARYNYIQNANAGNHGTESGWPARSGIAIEAYGNEFVWTASNDKLYTAFMWRGGSIYLYDNTFTNYQSMAKLTLYRAGGSPGNSPPAGTAPYDGPGPPTGYPLIDQHGRGQAAGVGLENTQPQAANKAYIWNNTLNSTGGGGGCSNSGDFNELSDCDPSYIVKGRDYEYSSDASAAPANYVALAYPHPLISGTDTEPPIPPSETTAVWDFGDESAVEEGLTGVHTYEDSGIYTATLTVTDNSTGGVGFDTVLVTILNVAPVVDIGLDRVIGIGVPINFTGNFTDPGSLDTHTFAWNFGDGSVVSTVQNPTHIFIIGGSYNVSLTVTDNDGGSGTDNVTVLVQDNVPVVDAGNDVIANEGDAITFSGAVL